MTTAAPRAVVVGAGIVGTWHAVELVAAGCSVDQLDVDNDGCGASVRNFGLVWVSGRRSGEELAVALRARERWEEIAESVPGIGFRPTGSLTVASTETERDVMEAFGHLRDAADRTIEFLEPDDVRAANPAIRGAVTGALHCERDAVVEPRLAAAALRAYLEARAPERYRFHPGRRVVGTAPKEVIDTSGTRWAGDLVVVATGAAYDQLASAALVAQRLRRVRLQMFETERFAAQVTTSIADADSLRYYPAYESAPRSQLGPQNEVGAAHHLQLLVVQRADGGLTIGDTHDYGEPFDFALSEEPTRELVERAQRILGVELPPVRRRWEGVYAECLDGSVCLREQIDTGVWLVTGPGGRGMTCSPAIAQDTLAAAGVVGLGAGVRA